MVSSTDSLLRVLIVGAGAVGLIYGYYLDQVPSIDVTLVARSNYEEIKSSGVLITSPSQPRADIKYHPNRLWSWSSLLSYHGEPFDFVIVASKSLGTEAIKGLGKFMTSEQTSLMLLQNGIDIEHPYRQEYPTIPIVSVVVRVGAALEGHNKVVYFTPGLSLFMSLFPGSYPDSLKPALEARLKTLQTASILGGLLKFEIYDDIRFYRWEKIMWNGTFNTICAVLNLDVGQAWKACPGLIRQVMTEIWTIADVVLGSKNWAPASKVDNIISFTIKDKDYFLPSTLQDVRKGKNVENEALMGNLVRVAEREGVKVPTLVALNEMLKGLNLRLELEREGRL